MKLVEAEAEGPIEGEDAVVTPPRPPHRRVSVSLLLTLAVLVGTVVTIYLVFPARHNVMLTEAVAQHRDPQPTWDINAPSDAELRAWAIGIFGKDVPLPANGAAIVGAKTIEVLNRRAASIRLRVGDDDITYLVQHAHGIVPEKMDRPDGDLLAVQWLRGSYICAAVGPEPSAKAWRPILHVP
jgi:hypothetical protein